MADRVIFIGSTDADAGQFEAKAHADFPAIDLLATNDRAAALRVAAEAEVIIGHHYQFDDELLEAAGKLRWIQSLTTGTDAILKLKSLRP
jgi:phosphoglycerate dehydrogenase-like enzyme